MDKVVFEKIVKNMDQTISDYEMEILYKVFDTDNSGLISKEEFLKVKMIFRLSKILKSPNQPK